MGDSVIVDCRTGHERGCRAMCCRNAGDVGFGVKEDGKACAKLGDDNHCTIYEERPQVCREYHCNGWRELQKVIGHKPIAWFKEL